MTFHFPFSSKHRLRLLACHFVLGMVLTSMVGCSGTSDDQPALGLVTGGVSLDGQPVSGAIVDFAPASGRPSTGITDDLGRFELDYSDTEKGAILGQHTVRISTHRYVAQEDGSTTEIQETIPAKFNTESTLSATVEAGENDLSFDLTKE